MTSADRFSYLRYRNVEPHSFHNLRSCETHPVIRDIENVKEGGIDKLEKTASIDLVHTRTIIAPEYSGGRDGRMS